MHGMLILVLGFKNGFVYTESEPVPPRSASHDYAMACNDGLLIGIFGGMLTACHAMGYNPSSMSYIWAVRTGLGLTASIPLWITYIKCRTCKDGICWNKNMTEAVLMEVGTLTTYFITLGLFFNFFR